MPVGVTTFTSAAFTRPADTTAYAAHDCISDSTSAPTVMSFTNAGDAEQSGYISYARIETSQTTCTTNFRLYLFSVSPTAINDNAAYTYLYANSAKIIGYIDFDDASTAGTGSTAAFVQNTSTKIPLKTLSRTFYGVLSTVDGFTPASAQTFTVQLGIEENN